jgi:hypothetical protein
MEPSEQRSNNWIAWIAFAVANLASVYVDKYLWLVQQQDDILVLLGVASVALGTWIVFASNRRLRSATVVLILLIVGQFGLIKFLATMLIWSIVGFAP